MNEVRSRRHGHQPFPSICHQLRGLHRIELSADDNLGVDALPTHRLLSALESNFDRIQVVGVAFLVLRRQIRKGRGASAKQWQYERREQFFEHGL